MTVIRLVEHSIEDKTISDYSKIENMDGEVLVYSPTPDQIDQHRSRSRNSPGEGWLDSFYRSFEISFIKP